MARPCLCCTHPERAALDAALVAGETQRSIAKRFGITTTSVLRHVRAHLPTAMGAAKTERDEAEGQRGLTLLEQAQGLLDKAQSLLGKAEDTGDFSTALQGVRQARECLVFIGRLQGDIQPDNINIIFNNPVWVNLQTVILAALSDEPSARAKVIEALANHGGAP